MLLGSRATRERDNLLQTPTEVRTRTSAGIVLMCVGVASLCVNDALAKT